ncbi:hypothetical protein CWI75_14210 [Kineobactrum sediminis]|uniref:Pilus assembly protein PilE n=1 Tax=Kineobactrum sediminis TaxID=1905677 RepID=A0A2N5XZQ2_9GAMM|nr:type IV pilin protein [Kineobactrum sediminis]PLW81621.1 hypothetical protein CWI75_14210 [Kineobactrum sediminis]
MSSATKARDQRHHQNGVTLIELMVVVLIVGLLLVLMLPAYQGQVRKAGRTVAQAELFRLLARQEEFFVNNRQYAAAFNDLGMTADTAYRIDDGGAQVATGGIYLITLLMEVSGRGFSLSATPVGSQALDTVCGTLQVTSTGIKSATGPGQATQCW